MSSKAVGHVCPPSSSLQRLGFASSEGWTVALQSLFVTCAAHSPACKMARLVVLSFLEGAQGSSQTSNDPEAINPPNSLGRQVNCCPTSISLRKPPPRAHPLLGDQIYTVYTVSADLATGHSERGTRRMDAPSPRGARFSAETSADGRLGRRHREAQPGFRSQPGPEGTSIGAAAAPRVLSTGRLPFYVAQVPGCL